MKKILLITFCFILVSMGVASASVMLTLETDSLVIDVNSNFDVDLIVSGLNSETLSVGDFDIDILYDPTLMGFVGYNLGTMLGDVDYYEALDLSDGITSPNGAPGAVDLAEVSLLSSSELDSLQANLDEFILATLTFHCSGPGTSDISIDNSNPLSTYKVGDSLAGKFSVTIGDPLTMSQVPEPSTIFLFGLGILGLGVYRNKFKN